MVKEDKNVAISIQKKILSHRLRGYDDFEHTPRALRQACDGNAAYLEIDVRASRDGRLFVYHNANTGPDLQADFSFSSTPSSEISKATFLSGELLLSLEDAVGVFKQYSRAEQKLCIDIKDFGFEDLYLSIVREAGIEDRVVFVSWIPQTLVRLFHLGSKAPLILSHWNLKRFSGIGSALVQFMSKRMIGLWAFVGMGSECYRKDLKQYRHGYQHVILFRDLPPDLLDILAKSRGGICIPTLLFCSKLATYCSKQGLELWLFSVKSAAQFMKYAVHDGVHVVFCDRPIQL